SYPGKPSGAAGPSCWWAGYRQSGGGCPAPRDEFSTLAAILSARLKEGRKRQRIKRLFFVLTIRPIAFVGLVVAAPARDDVAALEPAVEVDIGAARRAERVELLHR